MCNEQRYSLKSTLQCVLRLEFLQKIDFATSMSTDYYYAPSLFLKFGEIIVEYIVYKSLFGFPLFCFYYHFMKAFLILSKTKNLVKDINQIFVSNKLNEKKIEHSFAKRLLCEH